MNFLPGWFPGLLSDYDADFDTQFIGFNSSTTNSNTYSFASQAIGNGHPTRRVIVIIGFQGISSTTVTLSSATIGGVAATIHVQTTDTAGTSRPGAAIFSAAVPTGKTATIAITLSSANNNFCTIEVYRQINGGASPHATASDNTVTTETLSTTINIPTDGDLVAGATMGAAGAPTGITLVGVTEDNEIGPIETDFRSAAGHVNGLPSETGRTVSSSMAGSGEGALVAMSWGPA